MIRLRGGPAEGAYGVQRAPIYLRAVVGADGKKDVLNALEDEPREGETISVYRRIGEAGWARVRMARVGCVTYATGEYEWIPDVDGEALRETSGWRAWVIAQSPGAWACSACGAVMTEKPALCPNCGGPS